MTSQNFFSIVFGEAIQKFLCRAPAIGGDSEFNRVKFASGISTSRFGMKCQFT